MAIFLKPLGASLVGAAALMVALTAVSSPVEARRRSNTVGKMIAGAAVATATKTIARKALGDTSRAEADVDAAEGKPSESAEKPVDDAAGHAARAKAVLDAENKAEVNVANTPASADTTADAPGEISCYAGCNAVPSTPPRTVQSLREQFKSR